MTSTERGPDLLQEYFDAGQHGRLAEAWEMNLLGPVAFAYVAAQIPWRGVRLWRLTARPEAAGPYSADAAAHTPPSPPSAG